MTANTTVSNRSPVSGELWLTPVIGLILLGPLIYHWRLPFAEHAQVTDWRLKFRENIGLDIIIGFIPLLAAAGVQRLLRAWHWNAWARGFAGTLICGLLVGVFYYYALHPLPHWAQPHDEGAGDVMAIFVDDITSLGIAGGFVGLLSVVGTAILMRLQRR